MKLLHVTLSIYLLGFAVPLRADLFVLRTHGDFQGNPGVLRFDEDNGTPFGHFDSTTNGLFYTGETQEGMCFGPDGNLYTSGNVLGHGQVNCFDGISGQLLRVIAPTNAIMWAPRGLRFGTDGRLYVSAFISNDFKVSALFVFANGNHAGTLRLNLASQVWASPYDLAVSKTGLIVVSDYGRWQIVRTNGVLFTSVDTPTGLTFGPDGHLYVASSSGNNVSKFDGTNGTPLGTFVSSGSGGLAWPRGITFGPDGHFYVSCAASNAVFRYNGTNGSFLGEFVPRQSGGLSVSIAMLEFAPFPRLKVERINADIVRVVWPNGLTNFNLERSSTLHLPIWTSVTNDIQLVGKERILTNSTISPGFFRLRKQ